MTNLKEKYNLKCCISCHKGWNNLLDELLSKITKYNIEIQDIKEKFGGLRVYVSPYIEEVENIIREYEDKADKTCEICGKTGELRPTNWMRTLCNKCYATKYFKYKIVYLFHIDKTYLLNG